MKPIRFLILVMLLMSRIVSFAGDPPEFRTWKDMSEEEILEEYSFYKKSAKYAVTIQIGDLNYHSESFDGFTYDWRSALTGGEGSTEVRSQFIGVFHLRWDDPDYRSYWNLSGTRDTTIYDMEGLKRARKIVYEDWKKQFRNIKKLDGRVTGENVLNSGSSLHNSVVIKDNVKTSSGDDVILDYSYFNSLHYDESYYKETIDLDYFLKRNEENVSFLLSGVEIEVKGLNYFTVSKKIKSITFPEAIVDKFPSLEDCTSLEKLVFSKNAIEMPFVKGCTKLERINPTTTRKINLPSTLLRISSFENCENVEDVIIPDMVTLDEGYEYFYNCKSLKSLTIGRGVIDIPRNMCGGCVSLESVYIPNQITTIGDLAFEGCTKLDSVTVEDNSQLKHIRQSAFSNCTALNYVEFPASLESIGISAFFNCRNLEEIYAYMLEPFKIDAWTFKCEGTKDDEIYAIYRNAKLYAPKEVSYNYMITDYWSLFKHVIDMSPRGGGGTIISGRTYNYDITAKGKGDVVIDKIDESTGTEKGWTSAFDGLKMREEQRMVEIVHYPDSGVPFKFIPDAGYVVKQVQFSPDKDGTLKDVTDEIVYAASFSGYFYKAFDKDTSVKLVVTFEADNPDQPETILPVGDSFLVNTNNATCTYLVTNGKEVSLTNSSLTGKVNIPSTVSYGGVEYTVTAVGSDSGKVFETEGITEVVIPNTVKTIGANAFYNCTSMTSIQLPSSLKRINDAAFVGCSGLTVIDIPSNLEIIGMGCFTGCSSLRAFTVGTKTDGRIGKYYKVVDGVLFGTWSSGELSSLVAYPNKHGDTFVVPHGVTKILNYAFCLTEVKEVTLPVGLRIIYDYAFAYCSNLKKLTTKAIIPCKADNAFIETAPYATLHIPSEGLRELYQTESGWKDFSSISAGNSNITAFADKDRMMFYRVLDGSSVALIAINTEVKGVAEIPTSVSHGGITYNVTYIGTNEEKEVIMGVDGVTRHFNYSVLEMYGEHPSVLTGVVIPYTVTTIGNDAFSKAKITSVDIPGSVKEIGDWAFYLNEGLTSVTFESGLEKIGEGAFAGCSIARVDLPEGVTSIGSQAFNIGWLNMEVTIPATVHFIGSYAFQSSPDLGTELKINITDLDAWSRIESDGEYWEAPVFWYRLYQNGEEVHEVTIPTGMTSISKVFLSLQGLTKVTIPESVTDYGTAFYWCENLKEVVNLSETPQAIRIFTSGISGTRIGTRSDEQEYVAFGKTDKNACVLYVPTGTSTLYQKAEGWKDFKNILEISNTGIGTVESDKKPFDVYDLQGRKVRSGIISVDDLSSGIYIIRGKKVIVK